ncbi:MAG: excinuclease subunit, partial [Pseudomonadota bacterium]
MQESVKLLPDSAGVYRFYDSSGRLLYVGKAKNLKNRVKSYFRFTPDFAPSPEVSSRIAKMLFEARALEWTITTCEADALVLENSLIKQLHPKYNILLRDDKTYPYIVVDYSEDYPRLEITRKTIDGGRKKYYGPFVGSARELLGAIYEKYQLVQKRSCAKGKKACLFFQIERCLAPCQFSVDKTVYKTILDNAVSTIFDKKPLLDFLENKMLVLAENERYEEAAQTRDSFSAIKQMSVQSGVD